MTIRKVVTTHIRIVTTHTYRQFFAVLVLALIAGQATAEKVSSSKTALPMRGAWTGDLDGMKDRRLIRILVPYSKTIFFIDKGEQLGVAVEAGEALGEWLNKGKKKEIDRIRIEFIPTPRDKLLSALNNGLGDIVAGNLTITPSRLREVDFTKAGMEDVREILVTGPAAPDLAKIENLAGKELYVRKSSSYHEHLVALNATFAARGLAAIKIVFADEDLEDEDLLEMVNAGLLPYVIVDNHKAVIWGKVFTRLKLRDDISINDGGEIAWAIRKNSPLLKAELDAFVEKHRVGTDFGSILRKRYYTDQKMLRRAFAPEDQKRFNELVEFFRRYATEYDFDYLMIVAQGYQESRLNQSDRSSRGAVGIMQIKPSTAREKSIAITGVEKSAEKNIQAGNKYLRYLIVTYINDPGIDAKNQTLFAFAAYNAGPGNLKKFRAKAQQMGLDPNIWFGNVENAAAVIIGRETVQYVSNIYKYYIAYSLVEQQLAERAKARKEIGATK
jgi:membrane-bound lytic murein transglycosylase MltF